MPPCFLGRYCGQFIQPGPMGKTCSQLVLGQLLACDFLLRRFVVGDAI